MKHNKLIQYGFDIDKVFIEEEAYILGSLPQQIIQEDGQWDEFLPIYESQADKYETWGCTVWGSENQIETYEKYITGKESNYDERFIYLLSNVEIGGANPQNAYEAIRHNGLIENESMPNSFKEFIDKSYLTDERFEKAKEWLNKWIFKHEWIKSPTKQDIKENLKYSPITIAVTAWFEENGLYVDRGQKNTHWVVCYGYIEDERGIVLKIFDSYDKSHKLIHPDHNISIAKRILLLRKLVHKEEMQGIIAKLLEAIKKLFATLFLVEEKLVEIKEPPKKSQAQLLLEISESFENIDPTPKDIINDKYACAESLSAVLQKLYPNFPNIVYTPTFVSFLKKDSRFKGTLDLGEGYIIINATGSGNGTVIGHSGIIGKNGTIWSNDSYTGKWSVNYNIDSWKERYRIKGGMPTLVFKPL